MRNDLYCLKSGNRYYGVIMCFFKPVIVRAKSLGEANLYEYADAVTVQNQLCNNGIHTEIISTEKERHNYTLFLRQLKYINNFKKVKYATCNHTH